MKVFLLVPLLACTLYPSSLLAASTDNGTSTAQANCTESVDAVDDINFADNIIECNEEAVIVYDQESRQKFLDRKALSPQTYENQQRDGVGTATVDEPVHIPGATFIIRASYKLAAPQLALVSLHQQMATYCPQGWELDRQWSRPIAADYYLHYEFTCTDTVQ